MGLYGHTFCACMKVAQGRADRGFHVAPGTANSRLALKAAHSIMYLL